MSAEAALAYLKRHDILVGERVVVATNNDRAYSRRERAQGGGRARDDRRHARRRLGRG